MGGLASALCVLLMFLTGMVPFATYAMPAAAGTVLLAVVIENGRKVALLVYLAVSFLSFFVVPDREAALMFFFFFGYYSIIKGPLDRVRPKPLQFVIKTLIFNAAVIAAYWIFINLFGIKDVLDSFGTFGQYSLLVLLVLANITFWIYDFFLSNAIVAYCNWFRPKFWGKRK